MGVYRYTWKTFAREMGLILGAVIFCLPIYLLAIGAVKSTSDTYLRPTTFPSDPHWDNFSYAWEHGGSAGLGKSLQSSLIITVGSVVALIAIGSLCAWVLARRSSKLSVALYFAFVLAIILPPQLAIIPLYVSMRHLGLVGNYAGMILLYTGLLMPFTVFMYTGFVRAIPRDYEEAAQVDGAGVARTFFRVIFPLLRPVTGTVAVLAGLFVWNDFFMSLIFLGGSDYETLPVALYSFVGQSVSQWNLIFAAVVISIVPVLLFYLFAQRQLIRGFSGGVRG